MDQLKRREKSLRRAHRFNRFIADFMRVHVWRTCVRNGSAIFTRLNILELT